MAHNAEVTIVIRRETAETVEIRQADAETIIIRRGQ